VSATVAVVEQGRYPFAVRHPIFQCCVLVSLLVARLLFGEMAHATPHQMMVLGAQQQTEQQAEQHDCPDHAAHSLPADQVPDAAGPTADANSHHATFLDTASSHDRVVAETFSGNGHCCEVGECECLCVHISVATAPCLSMGLVLTTRSSIPSRTVGLIQSRPSVLFRPPAA